MPSPSPAAQALLNLIVPRADDDERYAQLALAATKSLGGDLNKPVLAEDLTKAKAKLVELCDRKEGLGKLSVQVGQYAEMCDHLAEMAALAVNVTVFEARGDVANLALEERLKAFKSTHDAAGELLDEAKAYKELLEAMLVGVKLIEKQCREAQKKATGLTKAAELLKGSAAPKSAPRAAPSPQGPKDPAQVEQERCLAKLKAHGLHFILVADEGEAARRSHHG